jgi:ubiquinone/menaquinone biosynthesis C-methylase UbiE
MQPDSDVINKWTGSAPFWEKHRDIIRYMFAPVSQALAEEARVVAGKSVLDVATGPGEPALSLAAIVGPRGIVCGVDPIPGMVEAAQRAAHRQGFANAHFEVASADTLPYPDAAFDAVVSRFGVMFFPSPVDGVREMMRVLKPSGKLALAAWSAAERNPFHHALSRVVRKHADSPPPDPDAPETFRFAPEGKLRDVLLEAGGPSPAERLLRFTIEAPLPPEEFLRLRLDMSDKLRETFAAFSPEKLAEVTSEMLDSLGEYATGSGLRFPAEVWIVSATRPHPERQ